MTSDFTNEKIFLGLGCISIIGGGYYAVRKFFNMEKIKKRQRLYQQSIKCNLNQLSIKKQSQLMKNGNKNFLNRTVCIQNVIAHFEDKKSPKINFISSKYDDFPNVSIEPFYIVQRNYNKDLYSVFKVNSKDTLISQEVMIPNVTLRNPNNAANQQRWSNSYQRILTSTSGLGVIGTLSFAYDESVYVIDAKIIGCSLQQIKKIIDEQKYYNGVGIFLGSLIVVLGLVWTIKTVQDMNKKRVPLQMSLLNASTIRN